MFSKTCVSFHCSGLITSSMKLLFYLAGVLFYFNLAIYLTIFCDSYMWLNKVNHLISNEAKHIEYVPLKSKSTCIDLRHWVNYSFTYCSPHMRKSLQQKNVGLSGLGFLFCWGFFNTSVVKGNKGEKFDKTEETIKFKNTSCTR